MAHIPHISARVNQPRKAVAIAEVVAAFAFVMAYIWRLRGHPWLLVLAVACIVGSHVARHESAAALGFRTQGFDRGVRECGPALAAVLALAFVIAFQLGTIRDIGAVDALEGLAFYLPWGLFQEYLMLGFFLRRLEATFPRPAAVILTAAMFCAVHTPNRFLMAFTALAAFGAIWLYRHYGNLYLPGLAHALLGFTLFMTIPDSLTHHLRIGPGWYRWY